jgi:two-component system KDP operon response regulator KdpE
MILLHRVRYNNDNKYRASVMNINTGVILEKMNDVKKKRVLVVDDHPKVLTFIEIDLKLRGFEVFCAGSGEKALELIGSKKPDIMLLDVVMPGVDGFEVLKELRSFSSLPVICFSASPGNQDPALNAGANEFMHKPFDPDDMARKIDSLLKSRD